jgi:hypothetical protein
MRMIVITASTRLTLARTTAGTTVDVLYLMLASKVDRHRQSR